LLFYSSCISLDIAEVAKLEQINGVHLLAQIWVQAPREDMQEDKEREQELQSVQVKIYTLPVPNLG